MYSFIQDLPGRPILAGLMSQGLQTTAIRSLESVSPDNDYIITLLGIEINEFFNFFIGRPNKKNPSLGGIFLIIRVGVVLVVFPDE